MEGSRDWAGLVVDILECISGRLTDPEDFVLFRAVCLHWRDSTPITAHAHFTPWILETEHVYGSGDIQFYSLGSGKLHKKHVPALVGKTTRLAGLGAGLLIGVDCDDDLSAVLANPLTGDSSALPRLPEWCRHCHTYGFITDPKVTGEEDVFVAIYDWWWPAGMKRLNLVALWRLGDAGGWATIPSQKFWPMMPQYRSRLSKHGPKLLEEEMATAAVGGSGNDLTNGGKALVPGVQCTYLLGNKDRVRILSRIFTSQFPRLTFELYDFAEDTDTSAPLDWASAPELEDKVILHSEMDTLCYLLPPSDDLAELGLRKNCIYFLSHMSVSGGNYYLCKWDLHERVATVMKQIPGVWEWVPGKWFLPTLRRCSS